MRIIGKLAISKKKINDLIHIIRRI